MYSKRAVFKKVKRWRFVNAFLCLLCFSTTYEAWGHLDDVVNIRLPAAKPLASVNTGPARQVRLLYLIPTDVLYKPHILSSIKDTIRHCQAFYSQEMARHGFHGRKFNFETNMGPEPLVHIMNGANRKAEYMNNSVGFTLNEISGRFDVSQRYCQMLWM